MTKRETILKIAKRTQISYESCERIIDLFFDSIRDAVLDGDKFVIRGFGTFEPAVTQGTNRYDLNSHRVIASPERKTIKYRVSSQIKKEFNRGVE